MSPLQECKQLTDQALQIIKLMEGIDDAEYANGTFNVYRYNLYTVLNNAYDIAKNEIEPKS